MYKEIFEGFDSVKAPRKLVDKYVSLALKANDESKTAVSDKRRSTNKALVCAMAACLMVVFLCTLIAGFRKPAEIAEVPSQSVKENSFVITALASDNNAFVYDSSLVGVYAGELTGGWAMYNNYEKNKGEVPNFFQSYCLNSFFIKGEGIESVTLKTDKKGTYFALSPDGYYSGASQSGSSQNDRFVSFELSNSVYSAQELASCKDGLSYGEIFCDGFTYKNTEKSNCINLGSKIEFVLESNSTDANQEEYLSKLWLYEEEIVKEKGESNPSAQKLDRLYLEMSDYSDELQEIILEDCVVDVIVKFADGTEQTKKLDMRLLKNDSGKWLCVSEICE